MEGVWHRLLSSEGEDAEEETHEQDKEGELKVEEEEELAADEVICFEKTCSSFAVCLPALIISLLKGGDDLGALFATEEGMARQEGEEGDQKKDEPAKKRKRQKKKD